MGEAAPNPNCPGCQAHVQRVAHLERQVEKLTALVDKLRAALHQNSSNSSRPPSADSPSQRADRPSKPPSGKQPGSQPAHEAHLRAVLSAERVTRHERRDPTRCRRCAAALATAVELEPLRHQVIEIPRIVPDITEYVLRRRCCGICKTLTAARLPTGVPHGMCGPRLSALIVLLNGVYHASRRNTAALLDDVLGVKLALSSVSNVEEKMAVALGDAHTETLACVRQARVKHLDATGWLQNAEPRQRLQAIIARLEPIFVGHLEHGVALRLPGVSGACANFLAHRDALFTNASVEGVSPTNNHAELELRGFVMWRKQTVGTRSGRGDLFAERVMTAVHTLRNQGRHVLSYLEQTHVAMLRGAPTPARTLHDP